MTRTNPRYHLSIDIGGTFTDLVLLDREASDLAVAKVLTSADPSAAAMAGLRSMLASREIPASEIFRVIHGTTLVTNALIERKGAKTALLTTEGFRDGLEIGREGRYDIYDLFLELPEPLVERRLRFDVPERLNARGEVIRELDETAVRSVCQTLRDEGVEAVAVSFLHSYANPVHEQKAAALVRQALPDAVVSTSHSVAAELGEYERTSTTVANAFVRPLTSRYLKNLEGGLEQCGVPAPLHIMLSHGGTCSAESAADYPVRLVESGPCGGALAAAYFGGLAGREDVFAFDMGGTTAKAILSRDGEFPVTTRSEVARVYRFKRGSGLPLLVPVLDMVEIGAGGGSIARLNELGLPQVGPESAGASPGPACYDRGGSAPTVTDADLVLGYLDPSYFLGGQMSLNTSAARRAIGALAGELDSDVEHAAWGIFQIVNENMANAARVHAAERGVDLRGYAMVATGGAGPVHACPVAARLGIKTVVVPQAAGVGSALGLMMAPVSFDFARSYVARLDDLDGEHLNDLYGEMEQAGRAIVTQAGVPADRIRVSRSAEARYVGQGHEVLFPVQEGELDRQTVTGFHEAFEAQYKRLYGRVCDGVPAEGIHWRVTVSGPRPELGSVRIAVGEGDGVEQHRRPAIFDIDAGPTEVAVHSRYALAEGMAIEGPAIVEEAEATTVVPPQWRAQVQAEGNLVLRRQ